MEVDAPTARRRQWPYVVGALSGAVLGLLLAVAEITSAVVVDQDERHNPRYRVRILGVEVFRYPEDGEIYKMRPGAQVFNLRKDLALGSTLVGAVVGAAAGFAYCRLTNRST